MALVLAEVVHLERPAVGAGEGEKGLAALEPGDVDARDIAVERAEFDRPAFDAQSGPSAAASAIGAGKAR